MRLYTAQFLWINLLRYKEISFETFNLGHPLNKIKKVLQKKQIMHLVNCQKKRKSNKKN